jgi:DNA-binding beta-propeller fold protein YncE
VGASTLIAQSRAHYHVIKRVVIGHASADYLTIDPVGRRLYGLGDRVFDVDKDTVIGSVKDGGGGYVIAPDQNRGVVRNGVMFDLKTLAETGRLEGVKADGILYDPVTHRGFTWADKDTWVIDMTTGKLITRSTSLGDGLESGAADGKGKYFANVESAGSIQVADARALKVDTVYHIAECKPPAQGLSMDRATRRLFMACDNGMVIINADNGHVVTTIKTSGRADQNAFDPELKVAFNPNRTDSTLTVVHEDTPDKFSVEVVPTGGPARTCAVDPKTHKLYVFYYEGAQPNRQLVVAVLAP